MGVTSDGVWTVDLPSAWLNANGELALCLAQPNRVTNDAIGCDAIRPDALALIRAIFDIENSQQRLRRWLHDEPGILVFPEYSFGSSDFDAINALISAYPRPLIVLAGFGATRGQALLSLLGKCNATWPNDAAEIDPEARYNAGWCWVHTGTGEPSCHIFLKNFLDQRIEIAEVPGIVEGKYILRLLAPDVVIYPFICADLICDQPCGPRQRIAASLPRNANQQIDMNYRVLMVGLLHTPIHDLWRTTINTAVVLQNHNAGLCTVNQITAGFDPDPEKDKWRCLSGAFIDKQIMKKAPSPALPTMRYVETDNASGLILRWTVPGIASGRFRWEESATRGRNVWMAAQRKSFTNGAFQNLEESASTQEVRRYLARRSPSIRDQYDKSIRADILTGLNKMANEVDGRLLAPRLWPRMLSGPEEHAQWDADDIEALHEQVDSALGVVSAIEQLLDAKAIEEGSLRGQMRLGGSVIMVWVSPDHHWPMMEQILQRSAIEHPSEPRLFAVCKATRGQGTAHKLKPSRLADFTASRGADKDITVSRYRHIEVRLLGEIENPLLAENLSKTERADAMRKHLT